MIIDLILDRKDGKKYDPKEFCKAVKQYNQTFGNGEGIIKAMDNGTEDDVKRALVNYLYDGEYHHNRGLMLFVGFTNWLN